MGFRDALRQKAMSSVTPSETAVGQQMANILTTTEFELLQAVGRLVDAADDIDDVLRVSQGPDERQREILEVADAVASQEFESWWWDQYGADVVDHPEEARDRVGLDKSEWQDQIETWATLYRDHAPEDVVDGKTDAQVAALYVEQRFGVSMATFANDVVEWNAPLHLQHILRRNITEAIGVINQVADVLDEDASSETEADVDVEE